MAWKLTLEESEAKHLDWKQLGWKKQGELSIFDNGGA